MLACCQDRSYRQDLSEGRKLWLRLRDKIHMLITIRRKLWGAQDMYSVHEGSVYMDQPLGDCVINPDNSFRQGWCAATNAVNSVDANAVRAGC